MAGEPQYLGLDVDLVGFISAKLRDLRGIRTLANELIQNADDADGTTEIRFDFCKDALYVSNDGMFQEKDFDRFRRIASGGKRDEEDVTGAFGIGFISVYQITDRPELLSSNRHWRIRPELAQSQYRVEQFLVEDTRGTVFKLPWALDPNSAMRQQLRAEPVDVSSIDDWVAELAEALPGVTLFLKRLNKLQLCRGGEPVVTVQRLQSGGQIILEVNGRRQFWHVLEGDFAYREAALRQQFPQIEKKRNSKVRIAVPADGIVKGLLCACLPTQMESGLPAHVNADFFPTVDRKRLQFDNDFQAEWNRAAIQCAANLLASRLGYMRDHVFGHKQLWEFLDAAYRLATEVRSGRHDRVFAEFWEQLKPALTIGAYVFTTNRQWAAPHQARFALTEDEDEVRELLQEMGIVLVHPDLRPFYNLLIAAPVSVKILDIKDVTDVFKKAGLTVPTALSNAPTWLQEAANLPLLWRQLIRLMDRRHITKDPDLASCAMAPANGGALYPPAMLMCADSASVDLFRPLLDHPFLAECTAEGQDLFGRLCPALTADQALSRLAGIGSHILHERIGTDSSPLLRWFGNHQHQLNDRSKAALAALPIFPAASGGFRCLTELSLPGGFDDPLRLADLVDLSRCHGLEHLFRELGVRELTFIRYVQVYVLPTLQRPQGLRVEQRQPLVNLLADHWWELEENSTLHTALSQEALVECSDGAFRVASEVYFPTPEVRTVLGTAVHFSPCRDSESGVGRLHRWLGVRLTPRPADVVQSVKRLVSAPPDDQRRQAVESIFRYLSTLIQQGIWDESTWAPLKAMEWLPTKGNQERWYAPNKVNAIFQEHLFASQGRFLDLPQKFQTAGSALMDYLDVQKRPTVTQVVNHLLRVSSQVEAVNREVFTFLNQHVEDPAIERLKQQPCILLPQDEYVRPDQIYWAEHPFGTWRIQLGRELRAFDALFTKLGVRDQPDHTDAIAVLQEIAEQFSSGNSLVDGDTQAVVLNCWRLLSHSLSTEAIDPAQLAGLAPAKVIVNDQHILRRPDSLFFEDRGGIGARFRDLLQHDLIVRPHDAWPAMQAAGVRPLREAADVHIIQADAPQIDVFLFELLAERFDQVVRCLDAAPGLDADRVRTLQFVRVESLRLQWSIQLHGRTHASAPEDAPAFYHAADHTIYHCVDGDRLPWGAIAREIGLAAGATDELGFVASGIKEILRAESYTEAVAQLSDLGYAEVSVIDPEAAEGRTVDFLGGDAPPDEATPDDVPQEDEPSDHDWDETMGKRADWPTESNRSAIHDANAAAELPAEAEGGSMPPRERPIMPGGLSGGRKTPLEQGSRPSERHPTDYSVPVPRPQPDHIRAAQSRKGKRYRLISYVVAGELVPHIGNDAGSMEERTAVDEAGIERVQQFEASAGRIPFVMPHNHPGYDLESSIPDAVGVRYIEVKSLSCRWADGEVALSDTQYQCACEFGAAYWLYVVERPLESDFIIHRIQNPALRVTHYAFDQGWQALDEGGPSAGGDDE